jgi:hypothetical protein
VFGCPAQIFVRSTIRADKKLSDRSISGTFVGISDKGNGYILLVGKSNKLVQIDSKDAKFNETFSDYRERQGQLSLANHITPDLMDKNESEKHIRLNATNMMILDMNNRSMKLRIPNTRDSKGR